MAKDKKQPKERKASNKQVQILTAFGALSVKPADSPHKGSTPSEIGQACGKDAGSPAADWAYPAIKTLVRKGKLVKCGSGRYSLPTSDGGDKSANEKAS